jgi:hypothetical protein
MSAREKGGSLWTCIGTSRPSVLALSGTGFSLCSFDLCHLGSNRLTPYYIVAQGPLFPYLEDMEVNFTADAKKAQRLGLRIAGNTPHLQPIGDSIGEPQKSDLFLTRAIGYSHSKGPCDHEESVRCDDGEPGKGQAGKTGGAK